MGWEGARTGVRVSCPANTLGLAPPQNAYRRDPLRLVAVLKAILEGEKAAVLKRVRGSCPFQGTLRCRASSGPHSPCCALPQDHHLPLSFHRRQEELKFSLGLQRLQHHVREIQALRDSPAGEGPGQDGSLLGVGLPWGTAKVVCPPGSGQCNADTGSLC